MKVKILNKYVGEGFLVFIVAEAGINHNGSMKIAKKMITKAKKVDADAVKFQSQGIGTKALSLIENEAKKLGIKKLVGRIMVHNKNSKKIFVNNDYKLKMWWYEKNIL